MGDAAMKTRESLEARDPFCSKVVGGRSMLAIVQRVRDHYAHNFAHLDAFHDPRH